MNKENKFFRTTAKNFKMTEVKFSWEFEGNGSYTQKHDEDEYCKFIEKNYKSISNQGM